MSDPPNPPHIDPSPNWAFTPDELQRFYLAKWKIRACEICEVTDWGVDTDNQLSVSPTSNGITISTLSRAVTVHLRINCRSCGNTKFLLAPVIRRWLDANP